MKTIIVELTEDELAYTSIGLDRVVYLDKDANSNIQKVRNKWDDIYRSYYKARNAGVVEVKNNR